MGYFIAYAIGIACIVFPTRAIKPIDALLQHTYRHAERRMRSSVDAADREIRPVFAMVIGVLVLVLTALVQKNAGA